jgi:hypothetical protein
MWVNEIVGDSENHAASAQATAQAAGSNSKGKLRRNYNREASKQKNWLAHQHHHQKTAASNSQQQQRATASAAAKAAPFGSLTNARRCRSPS